MRDYFSNLLSLNATLSRPAPPFLGLTARQPIRLRSACNALDLSQRRVKALYLVHCHFPHLLPRMLPLDWLEILVCFLRQVEQEGWFRIDWTLLNDYFYLTREEMAEIDLIDDPFWEPEALMYLARALDFIPFLGFGFDEDGVGHYYSLDDSHPPLLLLHMLLIRGQECAIRLGDGRFGWGERERQAAWRRLELVGALPEPLCWLPEIARYLDGNSGNPVLDMVQNFALWEAGCYNWHLDLELVCSLWRQAEPVLNRIHRFVTWASNPLALQAVLNVLVGRSLPPKEDIHWSVASRTVRADNPLLPLYRVDSVESFTRRTGILAPLESYERVA